RRVHPDLDSFPTRRSSDLGFVSAQGKNFAARPIREPQFAVMPSRAFDQPPVTQSNLRPVHFGLLESLWRSLAADFTRAEKSGPSDRKSTRLNSSHVKISYA